MYTSKVIKLHEKALAILEMITKVNNRIESNRSDIARFDVVAWDHPLRLWHHKDELIERKLHNQDIKARLVLYYANTMEQLIVPALHAVESLNVDLIKINQLKAAI